MIKGSRIYHEDKLVVRARTPNGRVYFQGKRVAKSCPLTTEERRAYVVGGIVPATKLVRARLGLGLAEAYVYVLDAAGRSKNK